MLARSVRPAGGRHVPGYPVKILPSPRPGRRARSVRVPRTGKIAYAYHTRIYLSDSWYVGIRVVVACLSFNFSSLGCYDKLRANEQIDVNTQTYIYRDNAARVRHSLSTITIIFY